MMPRCVICTNLVADGQTLCPYHLRAYANLREKYEYWKAVLGLSWDEYLREIAENSNSGGWVKELCLHLLKKEDSGP